METFIDNYKWPANIEEKYAEIMNREKECFKLDYLISLVSKVEIDEICLENLEFISSITEQEIDLELQIRSDLMKLSFDLWRDYDYFNSFAIKNKYNSTIYERGLKELNYNLIDKYWISSSKTEKDIVVKNLLRYIVCFSIWKQRKMMLNQTCSFCESSLNYSSFCGVCDTSIKDMIFNKSADDFNVVDFWICNTCKTSNDLKNQICLSCEHHGPHFQKWLCDSCHYINHPYDCICSVCYESNKYLKPCNHCQVLQINSKYDIICNRCKSIMTETWVCGNPNNHKIYGSKSMKCKECKKSPFEPPHINETVLFNNDGHQIEMWKCTYCQELNETEKDKCLYCLNLRYCSERTLCFYCGSVNMGMRRSCSKCKKKIEDNNILSKNCSIS